MSASLRLALFVITHTSAIFDQLHIDEFQLVVDYLSNQERCCKFRTLNKKCNAIYKAEQDSLMYDIRDFEQLISNDNMNASNFERLSTLHKRLRWNEQYIIELPVVLHRHQNHTQFRNISCILGLLPSNKNNLSNSILFRQLDPLTRALIETSHELTDHLISDQGAMDGERCSLMMLFYMHSFEWLSQQNNTSLPAFECIPYLNDNAEIKQEQMQHLAHLMDTFGLFLWHRKYTDTRWTQHDLIWSIHYHSELVRIYHPRKDGNHMNSEYWSAFDVKFLFKLLENEQILHSVSMNNTFFIEFVSIIHESVLHLSRNDGHGETLNMLISRLQRDNALHILTCVLDHNI